MDQSCFSQEYYCDGKQPEFKVHGSKGFGFKKLPGYLQRYLLVSLLVAAAEGGGSSYPSGYEPTLGNFCYGDLCQPWVALMCNYYTVRQDGSTTFMRSWALQGSMDGRNWTSLHVHEDDQTVCQPGQFASWPITGPSALLPFRFFRVALTGPATGVSNTWNLCICFLELYG